MKKNQRVTQSISKKQKQTANKGKPPRQQPKKKDKLFQQGHNETDKQFADRVFAESKLNTS